MSLGVRPQEELATRGTGRSPDRYWIWRDHSVCLKLETTERGLSYGGIRYMDVQSIPVSGVWLCPQKLACRHASNWGDRSRISYSVG